MYEAVQTKFRKEIVKLPKVKKYIYLKLNFKKFFELYKCLSRKTYFAA